jgi:phage FluMu protein Com
MSINRLKEIRCPECDRFLGYEDIRVGSVNIKCPRCKNWTIIKAVPIDPQAGSDFIDTPHKQEKLTPEKNDDSVKLGSGVFGTRQV